MTAEFHFANLTWTQVRDLIDSQRTPVLLWPVGSTEPHGPHSPLATDELISLGMCERAARALEDDAKLRARILPPLAFGVTRYSAAFPGGIHVQEDTLHAILTDVLLSLIHQGFRHNVVVNNHFEPEHVQTIHRAIDTVRETTGMLTGYLDLTRRHRAGRLTEEFREGGSHAGRYETSLILADHPALVDGSVRSALPPAPVNMASEIAGGSKDFVEMGLIQAYNGDPAKASAAEGRETYAVLSEMLVSLMRDLVSGIGGRDEPGMYGRV
jgi:creatinine amidohydrolase